MRHIEDASSALQCIMRRHDSNVWETGLFGELRIGIPKKGSGNPFEFKTVSHEMLEAATRQIETGTPAYRGELDFPPPPSRRRSPGKRRGSSGR